MARADSKRWLLIDEREHYLLSGRLYARLAPLLDGTHSISALIERVADEISAPEVY